MGEEEIKAWREVIIEFCQVLNASKIAEKTKKLKETKENLNKTTDQIDTKKQEKLLLKIKNEEKEIDDLKTDSNYIVDWLNTKIEKNIEPGKRIVKATHILKMTHSSAPNDGILIDYENDSNFLTTDSIPNNLKAFDMAHNNGNLITISRFLALSHEGESIYDLILKKEYYFLNGFSKDKKQLDKWYEDLSNLIEQRDICSASFTKQVYYPIKDNKYHLLSPLTSSTLAELIFNKITNAKDQKNENFFNEERRIVPRISFPKTTSAVVRVGGNNPQNISMLNRGRNWKPDKKAKSSYGIYYVLSCAPPVWQSQLKPPVYRNSFFYELTKSYEVKEIIQFLVEFLSRFESLQLSIKDPKRMRWIEQWINDLTDEVMLYVMRIQELPYGWSETENIKLKKEHQILLDWYRQDDEFQNLRVNSNWQQVIIKDFARWLNDRLNEEKKEFTPQDIHTKLWMKLFEKGFREILEIKYASKQETLV